MTRRARQSVGINLTWMVPGVVGGSEEYSIRLLRSLSECIGDELDVVVYCRSDTRLRYPELADRFRIEVMPLLKPNKVTRVVLENTWLAAHSRSNELMHHMGGVVPRSGSTPGIVTVYDLQPLEQPQNFGLVKRRWLGASIPASVRAAELVVTPSEFTRRRLIEVLGADPSKVRVVPFVFDAPQVIDLDEQAAAELGRYVLYPAIAYPHKRHVDLIDALPRLPADCSDLKVVFTGRPGPETLRLRRRAHDLGVADRVVFSGRVTEDRLNELYASASALVFPSSYEGFGNPCVEAMNLGCPIITSDAGSLPEVTGDAAIHVPVGDVGGWAKAIAFVASSPAESRRLATNGARRLATLSNASGGQQLVDLYHEALG